MEYEDFDQLKADVGLVKIEECEQRENSEFSEAENNGQPLPENIRKIVSGDKGSQPRYARITPNISTDKEELYVLIRISKDINLIKIFLGALLTIAIVAFFLSIAFGG